jgi:uncharacterized cupin superfamily protein
MATILKANKREFREEPNKIDKFRLFSDMSRRSKGISPKNLNFDLRMLNPGEFSAPYHFHRYAEELFMIVSGSLSLRTPAGIELVESGDIIFFEMGESGAHQFYNDGTEACIYLDVRSYIGYDIAEYPDSGKVLLAPSFEIFKKGAKTAYFEGEEDVMKKWNELISKKK